MRGWAERAALPSIAKITRHATSYVSSITHCYLKRNNFLKKIEKSSKNHLTSYKTFDIIVT